MNIFYILNIRKISSLHHHLVEAIPKGIKPIKCYKYTDGGAIKIPCDQVPKVNESDELISDLKKSKQVYLNEEEDSDEDSVKNKLKDINKKNETTSLILKKIYKRLKKMEKKKKKEKEITESSSEIKEEKIDNGNYNLLNRLKKALKRFKKKNKDHRSSDLKKIVNFIKSNKQDSSEPEKLNQNEEEEEEQSDYPEKETEKKPSLFSVDGIKQAAENMQNQFQDTIDGLMSHISDSGLDDIFSKWASIKKSKPKDNNNNNSSSSSSSSDNTNSRKRQKRRKKPKFKKGEMGFTDKFNMQTPIEFDRKTGEQIPYPYGFLPQQQNYPLLPSAPPLPQQTQPQQTHPQQPPYQVPQQPYQLPNGYTAPITNPLQNPLQNPTPKTNPSQIYTNYSNVPVNKQQVELPSLFLFN